MYIPHPFFFSFDPTYTFYFITLWWVFNPPWILRQRHLYQEYKVVKKIIKIAIPLYINRYFFSPIFAHSPTNATYSWGCISPIPSLVVSWIQKMHQGATFFFIGAGVLFVIVLKKERETKGIEHIALLTKCQNHVFRGGLNALNVLFSSQWHRGFSICCLCLRIQ